MRSFTCSLLVVASVLALSACAAKTELQEDQTGSDKMLQSPCACTQIDYKAPTYKWRATT
jgi:protein involved in sex pheromone biosynthesis